MFLEHKKLVIYNKYHEKIKIIEEVIWELDAKINVVCWYCHEQVGDRWNVYKVKTAANCFSRMLSQRELIKYTQRTLIRVERASSVLKSCIPIGQFQYKVNGYTRIDQWGYRILKLRGHVRHESMSTGCTSNNFFKCIF